MCPDHGLFLQAIHETKIVRLTFKSFEKGHHNLSILANQIISIELLPENFDPCDYVTWPPSWFVSRDWGVHS